MSVLLSVQIITYLALYVDDSLVCGNNVSFIVHLLKTLNNEFNITYGLAELFVGIQIEILQKSNEIENPSASLFM